MGPSFFTLAHRSCSCCRRGRRPRSRCRGGREGTQSRLHIGGSTWGRRRNRNCGCKRVICGPTNQTGRCKAGKVREPGSNRFPPGVGSSWVSQNKVLLYIGHQPYLTSTLASYSAMLGYPADIPETKFSQRSNERSFPNSVLALPGWEILSSAFLQLYPPNI